MNRIAAEKLFRDAVICKANSWVGSRDYCLRMDWDPAKCWAVAKYNDTVNAWIEPVTAYQRITDLVKAEA